MAITFTDMIFAIPQNATSNSTIWRFSEKCQPYLIPEIHNLANNGFKAKLLEGAAKKVEDGTVSI